MRRLLSPILLLAVAGALAVGSLTVLAGPGGPDDPTPAETPMATSEGDEGEEIDGDGVADVDGDDGEVAEGAERIAQAIADSFGVSQEDVLAWHEEGIGFGALFKLYALASAMGTDVQTLIDEASDGEGGHDFAFGEKWKALTEEQLEALDGGPKNLGQLVSAASKPEGAGSDAAGGEAAGAAEDHGPPPWAKAHGHD